MTAKFKMVDLPPEVARGPALIAQCAADVSPQAVEWLWPRRVGLGKLTLIAGEAGLGKSQLSVAMAAAVTTGGEWPCREGHSPKGNVIILSAEDGASDTVVPRLMAAGADCGRVTLVSAVRNEKSQRSFDLSADLALLDEKISEIGDVKLIIIDPISSYLGPKVDSHVNAAVRGVLEPVVEMAARLRIAIVAITHPSKGTATAAINRFIGSIAFVAAARAAFMVTRDPDDEMRRLFLPVKNNLAPLGTGLAFRLEQRLVADGVVGSSVVWETEPVTISADQALQAADDRGVGGRAGAEAEDFLRENLKEPTKAKDLEEHARAVGISARTLARARKKLGVIAEKDGMEGGWKLRLPAPCENGGHNLGAASTPPKNANSPEGCHLSEWHSSGGLASFGAAGTTTGREPGRTDPPHGGLDLSPDLRRCLHCNGGGAVNEVALPDRAGSVLAAPHVRGGMDRHPGSAMTRPRPQSAAQAREYTTPHTVAVYDGQRCLGHVLGRGRAGFEAFTANDTSVGVFPSQREAAAAIMEAG